ncbi:MAG: hypothetical protein DMG31_00985 [Acidobacteria bacterium]|nr:MAG: hypothetical protein DMG31_00985 [Acidobacteriota bacterium]
MATSPHATRSQGYERSDASPRGLLYFALIMAAILAATSLSLIWLFKYFQKAENPGSFVAAPFAAERPLPPPPRVQPNPREDLQNYYQSQQNLLNSYGWIDRQNGIVRLPIDRAMELLLQRGLPIRSAANPQNTPLPKNENPATSIPQPRGSAR